jgi:hypothetical protein
MRRDGSPAPPWRPPDGVRTLSRQELTVALAARQMLLARRQLAPADAIRRLTPLQAQHAPAPYLALAARLEGFGRDALEAAFAAREVVKTTIMRNTLHAVPADEYGAYAQLTRQARLRTWRRVYAHLDEERVVAELSAWLREPRTNADIRARVGAIDGVADDPWSPVMFARTLLPLVQLPPAGFWDDPRRSSFVLHDEPLPDPDVAAALVLRRYLAAFGPASLRDAAAWAGVAQRDLAGGLARLETVTYRDEDGRTLLDPPGAPLPLASTPLPVRLLAHWDQALLAYDDRERILPAEVAPLQLTISGDPTVTVDGRVAASWAWERDGDAVRVTVTPHVWLRRGARAEIRAECERTARICEPGARRAEVVFA